MDDVLFREIGLSGICGFLLWMLWNDRREFATSMRAIGITNLTIQKVLITLASEHSMRVPDSESAEECCGRLMRRLEEIQKHLDAQADGLRDLRR